MALISLKTLDHFSSSESNIREFILEFVGRFMGMNDNYIKLTSIIPVFDNSSDTIVDNKAKFRFVLRKTIVGKPRIYLEPKDSPEEITKITESLNAEIIGIKEE